MSVDEDDISRPVWWSRGGLTLRQERVFTWISSIVVGIFTMAWSYSIYYTSTHREQAAFKAEKYQNGKVVKVITADRGVPAPVTNRVSDAIFEPAKTTYLDDAAIAFLDPLRGASGKLHVAMRTPGAQVAEDDAHRQAQYIGDDGVVTSTDLTAPQQPGIYKIAVQVDQATRQLDDLRLITLVPFAQKRNGRIGEYRLGSWPYESGGTPRSARYANPRGFIQVTPQNKSVNVSEHFKIGDFLTKNQPNVWPKYLLLEPMLVDKLELVIAELEKEGVRVDHLQVMSGFRTPNYNATGGNTAGRANLSRHMYGDAADVFLDNNRDGMSDDVNGDGRADVRDAEFIAAMAERVERKNPSLVGGIGIYTACCGHGPFTHIDVRGNRARWRGSGNG